MRSQVSANGTYRASLPKWDRSAPAHEAHSLAPHVRYNCVAAGCNSARIRDASTFTNISGPGCHPGHAFCCNGLACSILTRFQRAGLARELHPG